MNKTLASAILGGLILLVSACSGTPAPEQTDEAPPASESPSTSTFAASPQTKAEIGVASWVLHQTQDAAVLEGQDANGTATTRATLHWTQTADGPAVDILFQNAHVQFKRSGDGTIADNGLDAFRKIPEAVAFATRASADLPQDPSDNTALTTSTLRPQSPPQLVNDIPQAGGCHQLDFRMQKCMQALICMGFVCKVKGTCLDLCNSGALG